jgi:hypothetical protein
MTAFCPSMLCWYADVKDCSALLLVVLFQIGASAE